MTRLERLEAQAARVQAKLDAIHVRRRKVQAHEREATEKARQKRRYQLGALVDAAGLGDLDDTTLAGLFAVLVPLTTAPDPVKLLESLISDAGGLRVSVDGVATAGQCVSPPVPSGEAARKEYL